MTLPAAIAMYYGRLFIESYLGAGGTVAIESAIDPLIERLICEAGAEAAKKLQTCAEGGQ